MEYSIRNDQITVYGVEDFDPKHILECGQVFRYEKYYDVYKIFAKNVLCCLKSINDRVIIDTTDTDFAKEYFDLDTDYGGIKQTLSSFEGLSEAVTFGKGLRLLKQDIIETIFSFIISANNNIPRIKGIIERLTEKLGLPIEGGEGRAFPTLAALAGEDESFYESIGTGYRAKYIVKTAKMLSEGFGLNEVYGMDTVAARKKLSRLCGVGPKVADCILLFAFGRTDVFPVDVWSERVYKGLGFPHTEDLFLMGRRLCERFGNLSGYAQQYLYYYYRENKID